MNIGISLRVVGFAVYTLVRGAQGEGYWSGRFDLLHFRYCIAEPGMGARAWTTFPLM